MLVASLDRDLFPLQNRFSHVHFHPISLEPGANDTSQCFDFQFLFLSESPIIDISGKLSRTICLQLLDAVVDDLKSRPVHTCHFLLAEHHDLVENLGCAHFTLREETTRIVAYTSEGSPARRAIDNGVNWSLAHADILA